jgi:O-antigen/teichoic acid export membrane protein
VSGREVVLRNALHLVLGQVTITALGMVFSAVLGRTLGASEFGLYFLLTAFSTVAYVLVDWGQGFYVAREAARQPERASLLLGTVLVLRTAGAALVVVPAGLMAWALGYDPITCWYSAVFVAVNVPFFLAQSYGVVFRGRDRMDLDAWVSVSNKIALLGLALAALALRTRLPGVFVAHALAGFLALALAARLYRRVTTDPLRYSRRFACEVLVGGTALFMFTAAQTLQPYLDAVILSKLAPADAIGWYGAAKTIMGTICAPAAIIGSASFPRLARLALNGGLFKEEIRTALRPMLWLGALAAIGTFLFADDAIAIVYGHQHFAPSGMILKVCAPALFLLFINVLFGTALFALEQGKAMSVVKVASVVVSTVLDLVLIPIFQQYTGNGGIGAMAAFGISEVVVFGGTMFLLRREVDLGVTVDIARALGSAALTLLLFWWLPPLPFLMRLPACVIPYLIFTLGLGLVRPADTKLLRAILLRRAPAPTL